MTIILNEKTLKSIYEIVGEFTCNGEDNKLVFKIKDDMSQAKLMILYEFAFRNFASYINIETEYGKNCGDSYQDFVASRMKK